MNFLRNKKLLFLLVIIALVGGGAYFSLARQNEVVVEEKTAKVTKGNISVAISFDGKSVVDKRDLSFELSGIVRGVSVKEGDQVQPWQTLAYLDTREAQKNLENEMRDYLSQRNNFEEMTQVTYPDENPTTDTIKRILEKNQWDLEKSVADYELKSIALQKSYLSSPIKGTIAAVGIKPGEFGATTKTAFTVVDTDSLVFESYVEDVDALKINVDQTARITFDALPTEVYSARVAFISPVATIDENDLSTYKVLITFSEQESPSLLDGMAGEVEIISKEVLNVVKIPNTTVKRESGKSMVYLKTDSGTEKREVELGFTNGKEVEVKSGLENGQVLIDWK
jgi:HlyD family secretion protein